MTFLILKKEELKKEVSNGALHRIPADMKKALSSVKDRWSSLTPLAQNEWICWVTHVKKIETRKQHIERLVSDLSKGKRRPCCWPGCPHRNSNAKKWF